MMMEVMPPNLHPRMIQILVTGIYELTILSIMFFLIVLTVQKMASRKFPEVLSVSNAVEELKNYSGNWITVAEELGLPTHVISNISVTAARKGNDENALKKVVEWWFVHNPNPEWTAIASVLDRLEHV